MNSPVLTTVDDSIGIISINNPPANVLTEEVFRGLDTAFETFLADTSIRGIILTGEGGNFAAGADISQIATLTDEEEGERTSLEGQKMGQRIWNSPIPILAAINGYALGGGSELALCCHLRIATTKARIGQPEIKHGFIPGMGGTIRLPRVVGPTKAMELLLTGEPIGPEEAHRIGLVNFVVHEDELKRQAMGLLKKIGRLGREATENTLQAVRKGIDLPLEEALKLESKLFGELMPTGNKKEGVNAFLEKRTPVFT
jgi:enoyl-CoA hydratase/carnithine racemase